MIFSRIPQQFAKHWAIVDVVPLVGMVGLACSLAVFFGTKTATTHNEIAFGPRPAQILSEECPKLFDRETRLAFKQMKKGVIPEDSTY